MTSTVRRTVTRRPRFAGAGEVAFVVSKKVIETPTEQGVVLELMTHRRLFGEVYGGLMPDYFWNMPRGSGVFIRPFVNTATLRPRATRPGDIDLLVVPYEGDDLVLDKALAIEVKVVRASFAKQGKSPNEFGVSQGKALLNLGFPYAAVAHLIVADASPIEAWQDVMVATVIDESGRLSAPRSVLFDRLPGDLIDRAYGRLVSACDDDRLGLVAAFVRHADSPFGSKRKPGVWTAEHRPAAANPRSNPALLDAIGDYFEATSDHWLDTPRFEPERR